MAEVSVDEETGEVTVHKIWAAHDCGRALNPVAVEGQVIGSVWMGLGQALQEEMVWKDGLLMNPGLLEYRSPSSVESPEIEPIIVESIDPEGPFGAKEAAKVRWPRRFRRLPTPFTMLWECDCVRHHLLRSACWPRYAQRKMPRSSNLTEALTQLRRHDFREHGGSLWFKGKGPERHALDPSRREAPADAGGAD